MSTVVYLGDEVSAAGWRLAGATVHTPAPGDQAAALARWPWRLCNRACA